ncbi:HD domain-containing protein [Candidatus Woesearchaeota archaeon]|nr:HD domain-containing protein [Candidatus Woesearchaeota archaeon]
MIKKLKKKILKYYSDSGHTFDHTERVYNLAVKIAKHEKDADMEVVKLSALLHDIARFKEKKDVCHAEEGAKMAEEILNQEGYDRDTIKHVCDCISTHRFSKRLPPKTKEAAILQDADRLDALGAMIIGRVFSRGGIKGKPLYDPKIPPAKEYPSKVSGKTCLNHFKEKSRLLKPKSFKTKEARKIAKERYDYLFDFVKRFEKEWRGEL